MNYNSYLCRYMAEHADYKERLKEDYHLHMSEEGPYILFKYDAFACDFSDPLVREARGIIIDQETFSVVCWPFTKFGNYNESYADPIDWASARVQEKLDGSIIKLWFDERKEQWRFSTNGTIDAEAAILHGITYLNFLLMIRKAENYKDIPFERLNKDHTYIFELTGPDNQVVVAYKRTLLYHIGTRNRVTGLECEEDIGIVKPKSYALSSLADCIKAAEALNADKEAFDDIDHEGFVVVDRDYHRIKIKSPDYFAVHHMADFVMTKERVVSLILEGEIPVEKLCEMSSSNRTVIRFYAYHLSSLFDQAEDMKRITPMLYEEYAHDRKAVAAVIRKHPLASVGFYAIDHPDVSMEAYLKSRPLSFLLKLIPDYKPVRVYDQFSF